MGILFYAQGTDTAVVEEKHVDLSLSCGFYAFKVILYYFVSLYGINMYFLIVRLFLGWEKYFLILSDTTIKTSYQFNSKILHIYLL